MRSSSYSRRITRRTGIVMASTIAALLLPAPVSHAGTLWVDSCGSFGQGAFGANTQPGISAANRCPGGALELRSSGTSRAGARSSWQATAPSGIVINHFWIGNGSLEVAGINDQGGEFGGGFYWHGGGAQVHTDETGYSSPSLNSSYVGWQMICGKSSCANDGSVLWVYQIQLQATENSGPYIVASTGLWTASGWVRGRWPIDFGALDASGVCDERAMLNGQLVADAPATRNTSAWQQCPNRSYARTVDTAAFGAGQVPLRLQTTNAAGVSSSDQRTVSVDNVAPTVSIAGPQDAPSTAGVQYVRASAAAGPSGVAGIACSLDGAPAQLRASVATVMPVQGIGVHHVVCRAYNNARDGNGVRGTSLPSTWTLRIRQPSVSTIAFAREGSALRCTRTRELVLIPAHWVTVRRHGKRVRVRRRAHLTTLHLIRCRRQRRPVAQASKRVAFGAATRVSGWVGTSSGVALGRQVVRIMSVADNGQRAFRQIGVASTAADGSWSARLPPGPSRVVFAVYDGAPTIEPSYGTAHVVVPASVKLSITPRRPHWGGTIAISGRLLGGFIPSSGEVLFVRLEFRGKRIEVQHVRTGRDGRFRTTYTFLGGAGVATYPFWVTSVPESDYPFAAGSSHRINVTVSP